MDKQKRAKEHPLFTKVLKNYRNKEKQFFKKNFNFLELSIFSFRHNDLLQQNGTHYLYSGKSLYTRFLQFIQGNKLKHVKDNKTSTCLYLHIILFTFDISLHDFVFKTTQKGLHVTGDSCPHLYTHNLSIIWLMWDIILYPRKPNLTK